MTVRLPFGAHKGERIDDVDESYLWWLVDLPSIGPTLREAVRKQLGLIDDGYGGSAAEALPGIIFRWFEIMRDLFPDWPESFVVERGFGTLKELCERVTGQTWPEEPDSQPRGPPDSQPRGPPAWDD